MPSMLLSPESQQAAKELFHVLNNPNENGGVDAQELVLVVRKCVENAFIDGHAEGFRRASRLWSAVFCVFGIITLLTCVYKAF